MGFRVVGLLPLLMTSYQVGVWIDVGSRFESEKENGAGYFVEHLAFKVSLLTYSFSLGDRTTMLFAKMQVKKLGL